MVGRIDPSKGGGWFEAPTNYQKKFFESKLLPIVSAWKLAEESLFSRRYSSFKPFKILWKMCKILYVGLKVRASLKDKVLANINSNEGKEAVLTHIAQQAFRFCKEAASSFSSFSGFIEDKLLAKESEKERHKDLERITEKVRDKAIGEASVSLLDKALGASNPAAIQRIVEDSLYKQELPIHVKVDGVASVLKEVKKCTVKNELNALESRLKEIKAKLEELEGAKANLKTEFEDIPNLVEAKKNLIKRYFEEIEKYRDQAPSKYEQKKWGLLLHRLDVIYKLPKEVGIEDENADPFSDSKLLALRGAMRFVIEKMAESLGALRKTKTPMLGSEQCLIRIKGFAYQINSLVNDLKILERKPDQIDQAFYTLDQEISDERAKLNAVLREIREIKKSGFLDGSITAG